MVGSVRNRVRRSRKIGTADQGFKRRKAFGIPSPDHGEHRFYERLVNPVEIKQTLGEHEFTVLIEPPFDGFHYYLSVSDLIEVLKLIPHADRKDVEVIAFRQPKRKERIFSAVWGRMAYWAEFGKHEGVAVVIEAIEDDYRYKVGTSIGPMHTRELAALEADGHNIVCDGKAIHIVTTSDAIRRTQLFRTLLHEIGHHVDYEQKVTRPSDAGEGNWLELRDLYFTRPKREREHFADRYAAEVLASVRQHGVVPFGPKPNDPAWGLDPAWFYFAREHD